MVIIASYYVLFILCQALLKAWGGGIDLIISAIPWGISYSHPHFMDEETDDKRLKNLLRITQLVTSGAGLLVK